MIAKIAAAILAAYIPLTTPGLAHDLQPGLYDIDVRVELPNLIDAATTLNKRICITGAMIDSHDAFKILMDTPLATCERQPICMNGIDVGFHVQCPGRSSGHANAKFKIATNEFTGTINMNMGGKNMTVIERQSGRRLGPCHTKK